MLEEENHLGLMTESVCTNQFCYIWVHQVSLFSISMFYLCVQKTFSTSICQRRIILQMTECQDSKKLHFWSFENKKQILLIDHNWEKLLTTSWCQIIFQTDFFIYNICSLWLLLLLDDQFSYKCEAHIASMVWHSSSKKHDIKREEKST